MISKEEKLNKLSVRTREGKDLGVMTVEEFKSILDISISKKGI